MNEYKHKQKNINQKNDAVFLLAIRDTFSLHFSFLWFATYKAFSGEFYIIKNFFLFYWFFIVYIHFGYYICI